jgi:hypothetical protein
MTVDATISTNFTLEELSTALQSVKSRNAAGFDGIYPEHKLKTGAVFIDLTADTV